MIPRPNLQSSLRRPALQRARTATLAAAVVEFFGETSVDDVGEGLAAVNFPYQYIERPIVVGSGTLVDGIVEAGKYPTANVMFKSFVTRTLPTGALLYLGGTLIFVVTGRVGQPTIVTWRIVGRALKNPDNTGADTAI